MPSTSKKQAKLMQAVAHGWHPDHFKGPTKEVAKEFVRADGKKRHLTKRAARKARLNAKSNVGEYRT